MLNFKQWLEVGAEVDNKDISNTAAGDGFSHLKSQMAGSKPPLKALFDPEKIFGKVRKRRNNG